jgi:hypothetical protein
MEAELREEEMAQEEEKEVDMTAVEATAVAVQAAAVQQPQQPQSQPLSHPQAETAAAAAAAAETPDEKAGVERTASGGKRAKESDEEGTSPSGSDEAKWVQYEQEVDAKRRKLSVKQKRRARKRAGRRGVEEAWAEEWTVRWAVFANVQQGGMPEPSEQRAWTERWTAYAAAYSLPTTGLFRVRALEDGSGPIIISLATGLPAAIPSLSPHPSLSPLL